MEFLQYDINELRTAAAGIMWVFFDEVQTSLHRCLTDGGERICHGTD